VAALLVGRDPVYWLVRRLVAGMRTGRALEHGCGFGRVAVLMGRLGWHVDGVDFSLHGLGSARESGVSVACGDIRALPMRDRTYDCAVSVGTVEHLREGPGVALRELHRVLKPGARAMVSVPFENPVRRARGRLTPARAVRRHGLNVTRALPGASAPAGFYQYSFRKREFGSELSNAGFRLEETAPYAVFRGLADQPAGGRALGAVQRRFGAGASTDGAGVPTNAGGSERTAGVRERLVTYARSAYDESDATMLARVTRASLGPLTGHMMAYFVRA
jgi:SAM-dependent methyltransferase